MFNNKKDNYKKDKILSRLKKYKTFTDVINDLNDVILSENPDRTQELPKEYCLGVLYTLKHNYKNSPIDIQLYSIDDAIGDLQTLYSNGIIKTLNSFEYVIYKLQVSYATSNSMKGGVPPIAVAESLTYDDETTRMSKNKALAIMAILIKHYRDYNISFDNILKYISAGDNQYVSKHGFVHLLHAVGRKVKDNTDDVTDEDNSTMVNMTEAEFYEFTKLTDLTKSVFSAIRLINKTSGFPILKAASGISNGYNDIEWQNKFVIAWSSYDSSNPYKNINIIDDSRWYIVLDDPKNKSCTNTYYLSSFNDKNISYTSDKLCAMSFDTKDDADEWVFAGSYAVLMPVKG